MADTEHGVNTALPPWTEEGSEAPGCPSSSSSHLCPHCRPPGFDCKNCVYDVSLSLPCCPYRVLSTAEQLNPTCPSALKSAGSCLGALRRQRDF